jgi:hypothetical protein
MNIGGRIFGTSFAAVTSFLAGSALIPGDSLPQKFAVASAVVALGVTLVAVIACFFLPEPPAEIDV